MIVYGHHRFPLCLSRFLSDIFSRFDGPDYPDASRDRTVDLFGDFSEAYIAVLDTLQPDVDDDDSGDAMGAWKHAMQALADAVDAAHGGDRESVRAALARFGSWRSKVERTVERFPNVEASTPEGFAYYAVYPEQYLTAAARLLTAEQPATLVCLGLRGIGAPLAHIVGAVAKRRNIDALVVSARPRGHPFDRQLRTTLQMDALIARMSGGHAAVIDEGPGLSGSSFAAGAEYLLRLGFKTDRVHLMPSWSAPSSAPRSARARRILSTHRQYVAAFEEVYSVDCYRDISAGRWRALAFGPGQDESSWPAVQPQHERRKYLSRDAHTVRRFAGLGRYGRVRFRRAQALAQAGYCVPPKGLERGFLAEPWIDRKPARQDSLGSTERLGTIARYISFVGSSFATGRRARVSDLIEMVLVNCREAAVDLHPRQVAQLECAARFDEAEVAIDGRMLPHEWIESDGTLLKTDALDHHGDDFLPGSRDIAWDVAGAVVELDLGTDAESFLAGRVAHLTADSSLTQRLPFYCTAYAAYRLGYSTLAAESLDDTGERSRFRQLVSRYRRSLEARGPRPNRSR